MAYPFEYFVMNQGGKIFIPGNADMIATASTMYFFSARYARFLLWNNHKVDQADPVQSKNFFAWFLDVSIMAAFFGLAAIDLKDEVYCSCRCFFDQEEKVTL